MKGMRSALLVAVAVSVSASTAEAATVERVQRTDPFGSPVASYFLEYAAAPGEVNDLEIRLDASSVTLHDGGAPLAAKGCEQVDPSTARCGYADPVTVKLAGGDDVARVVDTRPQSTDSDLASGPAVRIEAGAGADNITGGPGDEVFVDTGDGEADRFAGGGGADLVSYQGRKQPVRITVGAPREDVLDGIEILQGGSGDDVLTGDARRNRLRGGPGQDIVRGLGGNDDLDGEAGADRLYGGAGDDTLKGDSYTSGLGRDLLEGGRGDDFLDLGVADDASYSISGPTYDVAADGRKDTAHGGPGYDAFAYRDASDPVRSCEAAALDEFTFGRTLRRTSRTRLRLRVGLTFGGFSEEPRIVLLPRGRRGPRLTKPLQIDDDGKFTLRLTPSGVKYLRRHSAVTIRSDFDETIDARVSRRRGG